MTMRASTTVTLLCLAASVAPSVAVPSIKSELELNPRVIHSVDTASTPPVHSVTTEDTGAVVGEEVGEEAEEDTNLAKVAVNEVIASSANALVSTGIFASYVELSSRNSRAVSLRERLEHLDKRIKQELAARVSKRELLTTTLDNLDR